MEHKWENYFDTTSEYWDKAQKIYKENDHFPKVVVKNRNLHHKFPRSFSKKDGTEIDNDKDNLVSLSLSDHFLVHYYLWKSCNKKGYRGMMATAFNFMRKKAIKYATDETIEMLAKDYADVMKDVSELHRCLKHSDEWKAKNSRRMKGNQYAAGRHHSEETRKRISEAIKGKKRSKETKRKISHARKGMVFSEEHKKRISESVRDEKNPFYGKKHSEETKKRISESCKGKSRNKGKHWVLVDGKRVWY